MEIELGSFAGSSGVRLAADVVGNSDGVGIVLLPGAGQTRAAWRRPSLTLASKGYRVVSLDLRGHGGSDWSSTGDYSIDAFVGDVIEVLKAFETPPIVIGASIGGIALAIAIGETDEIRVKALVLVDVVPDMKDAGLRRIRAFMETGTAGFAQIEDVAEAIANYLPDRPAPASLTSLMKNLRYGTDGRLYWHWDPAFHTGSRARADGGMFDRMAAAARKIRVPTLIVSGASSDVVDRRGVEQLLRAIPNASWVDIPKAGHMMTASTNDAFTDAVLDFISHLPAQCAKGSP